LGFLLRLKKSRLTKNVAFGKGGKRGIELFRFQKNQEKVTRKKRPCLIGVIWGRGVTTQSGGEGSLRKEKCLGKILLDEKESVREGNFYRQRSANTVRRRRMWKEQKKTGKELKQNMEKELGSQLKGRETDK